MTLRRERSRMPIPRRLVITLLGVSLLSTACGARLTDEQRTDALRSGVSSISGVADDGTTTLADGTVVDASDPGAVPDGLDTAAGGGSGAPVGGLATAAPGASGATASGASADTRAAPAGGNGGATDIGVTADKIVISNVSDISGAVPGLFKDAQDAVKAYVRYFAATEGTIYGRRLELLPLDSRLDTGANRSASLQACNESFAGAGSVSAFDQGGAPVIAECGLPDVRGLATTDQMKAVPSVFPINAAGTGGARNMGVYGYPAQAFPDAVKKAAFLFIDGEVTRDLAEQDIEGAEASLGYDFIYQQAIGLSETNYSPFVQQMKSKGVRYVTFVGAYQQAASLAKTMRQQGFTPDVYAPTVTSYTPEYIKFGGAAVEGSYVAVSPSLIEEIAGNRELQLYAQFLQQVDPGAMPTGIGQYAWAAARLFVEKAKEIGPNLTRKALLSKLPSVHSYTGGGLFPPEDVGGRVITDCTQFVQVRNGKFVRVEPTQVGKRRCGDGVWDSKTDRIVKRG